MLASLLGPDGAWIGLSDILKEGTFMWRDGSPVRPTGGNGAGEGGQAEALSEGDVIMEIVLMVMTVMMG